ncbi:MAG TPA: ABC transporter ATP-binding protein [Candidatus Paceibacterota bacterium]|jgi:ATP-binding cassette subfamily B protein|nr:ABC transporter ATP-binding protein [Candidatus Paceibacterota bacterium]
MRKLRQKALSSWRVIQRANSLLLANKRYRRIFILSFIVSCFLNQGWLLSSWSFSQITNKLAGQATIFASVPLVIAVLFNIAANIVPRTLSYRIQKFDLRFRRISGEEIERLYWKSYAKFGLQDRENHKLQDALDDASRNQNAAIDIFYIQQRLALAIITVIISGITLATIRWWYFFIIVATVVPRMYFTWKRKTRNYKQQKRLNEVNRYKNTLSNYVSTKEAILNGSRDHYLDLFDSLRARLNSFLYSADEHFASISYWGDMWFYSISGGLFLLIALQVYHHQLLIGSMFIVFSCTAAMYQRLDQATTALIDLQIGTKKADDFFLILDTVPAIQNAVDAIEIDDTKTPRIEFDNVYFKYPGSEQYVLKGVSFSIEAGESVGLIAKNGEGKTTIALLLLRFYDPTEGSIRVNGIDLRLIQCESLLAITGALFQDFATLKTTIRGAILATRPGYKCSDFQMWQILERVGLKDYVEKLPKTINQKVDRIFKDSVKLSGGQNQKLGLAGLILRDPKFVLLDEFTSALDPEAEKNIIEQYKQIIQNKTALIISHRYMSLKIVDRIIVLHEGKIVESGKKEDLMVINDGIFHKLYKAAEFATSLN